MVFEKLDNVDVALQNVSFTQDCKYYSTTKFADLSKSSKKDLTLKHFNTRYLMKNKKTIISFVLTPCQMQEEFMSGLMKGRCSQCTVPGPVRV